MQYLKNIWYMAAWSDEVAPGGILARTLLDTAVAIFRRNDGSTAAIFDQCPHRFAPLSAGCLEDDQVKCAYHGLAFDGSGACTANPHGPIRQNMHIPSYATHERHGAIWIWMGEQTLADPTLIPDLSYLSEAPSTAFSKGYMAAKGNYEIFVDNLLDLSHTDYLHPDTLGGAGITGTKPEVVETDHYVDVIWSMSNTPPLPLIARLIPEMPALADTYQHMRWYPPGVMRLFVGTMPPGAPKSEAVLNRNAHILTPETANSSHYFFAATRNFCTDDGELNEKIAEARDRIFSSEDKPMIEAIQNRMGDREFWSMDPLLFTIDAAPVRVRRKLQKMIEAERSS